MIKKSLSVWALLITITGVMTIIPARTIMAEQYVYNGQEVSTSNKITSVGFDGELENAIEQKIKFKVGSWDDYWEKKTAEDNSTEKIVSKASKKTIEPLTQDEYEWISYSITTETIYTYTKIPPSCQSTFSAEPRLSTRQNLSDTRLMIDGVEFNKELITNDILYMNEFKKGSFFTLTLDGIVYDKCIFVGNFNANNDCMIQIPKVVKNVTIEYTPPCDLYEGIQVGEAKDKIVFYIKGGQS